MKMFNVLRVFFFFRLYIFCRSFVFRPYEELSWLKDCMSPVGCFSFLEGFHVLLLPPCRLNLTILLSISHFLSPLWHCIQNKCSREFLFIFQNNNSLPVHLFAFGFTKSNLVYIAHLCSNFKQIKASRNHKVVLKKFRNKFTINSSVGLFIIATQCQNLIEKIAYVCVQNFIFFKIVLINYYNGYILIRVSLLNDLRIYTHVLNM